MQSILKKIQFFICILLLFALFDLNANEDNVATFAGGCFWCTQKDFDQVPGVVATTVGFTGGKTVDPTYEEVSAGGTGHIEAVQVTFDPKVVSYQRLLDVYFHSIDPTDEKGQFCDRGEQYRPVIFYHSAEQEKLARSYQNQLIQSRKDLPFKVAIVPAGPFYPAEKYHQKYYQKRPLRYRLYRYSCGRDQRLKEIWGSHFLK